MLKTFNSPSRVISVNETKYQEKHEIFIILRFGEYYFCFVFE